MVTDLGEANPSQVPLRAAQPLARIAARSIDFGVWFGLQILAAFGAGVAVVDLTSTENSGGSVSTTDPIYIAVGVVAVVGITLYETVLVSIGGATVGKRVAGIRVVTHDGQLPDLWVAGKRIAPFTVLALIGLLAPATANWTNGTILVLAVTSFLLVFIDRRTVWDRLASTVVVEVAQR